MGKTVAPFPFLRGFLHPPPDKSISHRAALFAAMGEGESVIQNFSKAEDPKTTLECLRQLGVSIQQKDGTVVVKGVGRNGFKTPDSPIDCKNSGTTMRLLSGVLGGAGIECVLIGDESLSKRPMKRIIEPLQKMGIEISARDADYAPLQIRRKKPVEAIRFELPVASAQLKSCVLLAGLFCEETTQVIETAMSRDHTERLLQLPVENKDEQKIISSSAACKIPPQSNKIPGDFSAAAYWLIAAAAHPDASVELKSVGVNSTRTGALHILKEMGVDITLKNKRMEGPEPAADISVQSSALKPVNIGADLVPNCIDELPVLMIAMLFADGISTIREAGELRHKETDRLAAMVEILETAGASFQEKEDGLKIFGDPNFIPAAGTFKSYGDHRIAMTAAVFSLLADDTSKIIDADCTRISYPSFWNDLHSLRPSH